MGANAWVKQLPKEIPQRAGGSLELCAGFGALRSDELLTEVDRAKAIGRLTGSTSSHWPEVATMSA